MLKSMLGLSMDAQRANLILNSPILTHKNNWFEIHGLRGPDWELDLRFRRSKSGATVDVIRKVGSVRVYTVR